MFVLHRRGNRIWFLGELPHLSPSLPFSFFPVKATELELELPHGFFVLICFILLSFQKGIYLISYELTLLDSNCFSDCF